MPGNKPNIVRVYRIVHVDNVEYILRNGMFARQHDNADPNYINIGDSTLIAQRNDYAVPIEPSGNLGEYIPFYFGPLSPMLLNIKTGYRGIIKRPQADIIYICCNVDVIVAKCEEWCFTNGHAKNNITEFYNKIEFLDEVDWDIVRERYWNNNEQDFDRMRRKQAEFLVKNTIPVNCIDHIITYNDQRRIQLREMIEYLELDIRVLVNPKNNYYY